jgi:hypothetical protein
LLDPGAWNTIHFLWLDWGAVPKWLRERSAKPRCSGSSPLGASTSSSQITKTAKQLFSLETSESLAVPIPIPKLEYTEDLKENSDTELQGVFQNYSVRKFSSGSGLQPRHAGIIIIY